MNRPSDPEELTDWDRGWAAGWDDAIACKRHVFFADGARAMRESIASQVESFDAALAESIRSLDVELGDLALYDGTWSDRNEEGQAGSE